MEGFQFIGADEAIPAKPLFIVIGGFPGLGKTSISFTGPGSTLHVDTDRGIERAIQKRRPMTTRVDDYLKFKAFILSADFEAMIKKQGIKNIVLDTVGSLLDDVIAPAMMRADSKNARAGGLSLQGWGAVKTEFGILLSRLLGIGLNVIAIAHAKEEGDEQSAVKQLRLSVSGGSNEIILRKADMLGFITKRGGKTVLDFNPGDFQIGKNTARLEPVEIPDASTSAYDCFLSDIMEATTKAMATMTDEQTKAIALTEEYMTALDECTTYDQVNEVMAGLGSVPSTVMAAIQSKAIGIKAGFIYESHFEGKKTANEFTEQLGKLSISDQGLKLAVWDLVLSNTKKLGFVFDKKAKVFTEPVKEGV